MRDHVIVIPCDTAIAVDGDLRTFAFSAPPELHALHWNNGSGHMEYVNAVQPNRALHGQEDYAVHVAPYVRLWEAELERLAELDRLAKEAANRPPTLEDAKETALADLATRRWRAESGTLTVDGVSLHIDRESRALLLDAWSAAQAEPGLTISWKTADAREDGTPVFADLDAERLDHILRAVRAHVRACYALEAKKAGQIRSQPSAGAVQAWLETKLDTGWPA